MSNTHWSFNFAPHVCCLHEAGLAWGVVLDKPPGSFWALECHSSSCLHEVGQRPALFPHDKFPKVFE